MIHLFPDHTSEITWDHDLAPLQRTDTLSPQLGDEIAEFKQYVLSSTGLELRVALCAAHVVRRQQDDGEADIAVAFYLLDNRSAFVGLLVQNDRLKADCAEKAGNGFSSFTIMPMDNKDPLGSRPDQPWFGVTPTEHIGLIVADERDDQLPIHTLEASYDFAAAACEVGVAELEGKVTVLLAQLADQEEPQREVFARVFRPLQFVADRRSARCRADR